MASQTTLAGMAITGTPNSHEWSTISADCSVHILCWDLKQRKKETKTLGESKKRRAFSSGLIKGIVVICKLHCINLHIAYNKLQLGTSDWPLSGL